MKEGQGRDIKREGIPSIHLIKTARFICVSWTSKRVNYTTCMPIFDTLFGLDGWTLIIMDAFLCSQYFHVPTVITF